MTSPAIADGLLEQAVDYALCSVAAVTPELMTRPTPCSEWDLTMLLQHSCESLAALVEGIRLGRVARASADGTPSDDAAALFAARAARLLDGWAQFSRQSVLIGEYPLALTDFAAAGALEVAMHGWDVAQACGRPRPIPATLAGRLLAAAPLLITDADRAPLTGSRASGGRLFGPSVTAPPGAGASDRLAAFLGRACTCGEPE
jgi:uncharacterized protein (TIGR03086 family)